MGLAILAALLIGLCLGLFGSGGSILTVPVLVFILERPEKSAIAEGLAIVGIVASVGSLPYFWRQEISWKSVLFFGVPGMVGAFVGALTSSYLTGKIQLILFACIMLVARALFYLALHRLKMGQRSFLLGHPDERVSRWVFNRSCRCGRGLFDRSCSYSSLRIAHTCCRGYQLGHHRMNCLTGFIEQRVANHDLILQINGQIIFLMSAIAIVGVDRWKLYLEIVRADEIEKNFRIAYF